MRLPEKEVMIQFLKFGIVGVSNTVISLAVYYVFYGWTSGCIFLETLLAGLSV